MSVNVKSKPKSKKPLIRPKGTLPAVRVIEEIVAEIIVDFLAARKRKVKKDE